MAHSTCGHTADGDEWTYTTPRVLPRVLTATSACSTRDVFPYALTPSFSVGLSAAPECRLRCVVAHSAPQPCRLATRTPQVTRRPTFGGHAAGSSPCRAVDTAAGASVMTRNDERKGVFGATGAPG